MRGFREKERRELFLEPLKGSQAQKEALCFQVQSAMGFSKLFISCISEGVRVGSTSAQASMPTGMSQPDDLVGWTP